MIYDVFTYNGERDILALHLNILDKYVDRFVIVEARTTFSGKQKPLYFSEQERFYQKFWKKIDYYVIEEDWLPGEIGLAESSPNTQGAAHWKHEFLQKESIKKALSHLQVSDTVFIGDVDEIWEPIKVSSPTKLKLRVYSYYLNNRSSEEFWGTLTGRWGDIKYECLNHLRTDPGLFTENYYGWHFTSMGGLKEVRRKLENSYTRESYWTPKVEAALEENILQSKDFLGRDFTYQIEEEEWPSYLKSEKHRKEYQHLCK